MENCVTRVERDDGKEEPSKEIIEPLLESKSRNDWKKDSAFITNLNQPFLCAFVVLLFRDFTIFVKYWDLENVSPTELLTFFANNDNNAISFNERKDDFSSTICEKCSKFLKKKKRNLLDSFVTFR